MMIKHVEQNKSAQERISTVQKLEEEKPEKDQENASGVFSDFPPTQHWLGARKQPVKEAPGAPIYGKAA